MTEIDAGQAEAAFEQTRAALEALDSTRLKAVMVDVQDAAVVAFGVAQRDSAETRKARFIALAAANQFDLGALESLPNLALAAWHARRRQLLDSSTSSRASVSEETITAAQDVRGRMLKAVAHYFGEHPKIGPTIAAIRNGRGHQDVANDLQALADLYAEPQIKSVVERDPMYYDPEDQAAARVHAGAILTELGLKAGGQSTSWTDLTQRSWTLLTQAYEDVQAAGMFLFRKEEDVSETYPSLVGAVRTAPRRGGSGSGGPSGGGSGGGEPGVGA